MLLCCAIQFSMDGIHRQKCSVCCVNINLVSVHQLWFLTSFKRIFFFSKPHRLKVFTSGER